MAVAKKKEYKLDTFKKLLPAIDRKDVAFWDSLSEEERKGFTPFTVIQWLSGTDEPAQIYYLNELVNPFIFEFAKDHPELLYDLMVICSTGKKRYTWVKKKTSLKFPQSVNIIKEYFGYNTVHAKDALDCLSGDDIMGFAEELGYQKEELKKVKKECNERNIV
jgi:hypothetical protein